MTLEEIIAEMQHKPNAQMLLEWLYDELGVGSDDPIAEARAVIGAYFEAIES